MQERDIERVGSNGLVPLDIRVIAATKVDLKKAAEEGAFRQDLYYRLNVVTLDLPPLRSRQEDIPALFHHFLLVAAARYGKTAPAIPQKELHELLAHDWPGNVRELRNTAERFVLLGKLSHLSDSTSESTQHLSLAELVCDFEKNTLKQALIECNGSIKETMDRLQLPRKTLYDKMQKHQLVKESYRQNEN